jgi:chemotaxis protein methyltransferase CheR
MAKETRGVVHILKKCVSYSDTMAAAFHAITLVIITDPDFEFLRQLVYDQSSIHLGAEKKAMVCTRLNPRLSDLGLGSVGEYCERLRSHPEPEEITHLIDALATNFTTFFREIEHFKFLKDVIVPEFVAGEFAQSQGPFRAWSAACSTGEEPYSMAIVLASCFPAIDRALWRIFASDISTRVLEKATQGIYEESRVKLPNPAWHARFFQKGQGEWEGYYRVKRALREQVEFEHMNLLQPGLRLRDRYHVIFCRNVTIYFDHATAGLLAERLCHQLHEGGYLIVGHAESLLPRPAGLQQVKPSIFRKVSA